MPDHADFSHCPIAHALDVLGDRWTLLVLRDLLVRSPRRFSEFLDSPEGISTNILTARLRRLEEWDMLEKRAYQSNPLRYEYLPTKKSRDLGPMLHELMRWSNKYFEDTFVPPKDVFSGAFKKKGG